MKKIFHIILLFTLLTSCVDDSESTYKYEITGTTANYGVTYQDVNDVVQLKGPVGDGWSYTWVQTGKRWVMFVGQNYDKVGSVTVRLYKNGKIIAEKTESGDYAVASIQGNY